MLPSCRFLLTRGSTLARFQPQIRGNTSLTDKTPSSFERWLLVYFKKYPKGQVPLLVPDHTLEKVRNLARIRINSGMAILAIFGAIFAVYSGKSAQKEGVTLGNINRSWHEELKTQDKREAEEKARAQEKASS